MPRILQTCLLLCASNVLMSFAWYGHLRTLKGSPLWIAILASWAIAFFEYTLAVPANRISAGYYSVAQLKILQECISLSVFVPFSLLFLREKWNWNYLWAGLCVLGAVYFIFRKP